MHKLQLVTNTMHILLYKCFPTQKSLLLKIYIFQKVFNFQHILLQKSLLLNVYFSKSLYFWAYTFKTAYSQAYTNIAVTIYWWNHDLFMKSWNDEIMKSWNDEIMIYSWNHEMMKSWNQYFMKWNDEIMIAARTTSIIIIYRC